MAKNIPSCWQSSRYQQLCLGLICALLTCGVLSAENPEPQPIDEWRTISGAYFSVHFQQRHELQARKIASIYQAIQDEYLVFFEWQPADYHVVIQDVDNPINFSSPLPFNHNIINISNADTDQLIARENWVALMVKHAAVHLYHLDKASGIGYSTLRSILGRHPLLFPNLVQPKWIIEGIATYLTTDTAKRIGRGSTGIYDGFMRLELENGFLSVSRVTYDSKQFPLGRSLYYGYYFFEFIESKYGKRRLRKFLSNYSKQVPFMLDRNTEFVFGKDLDTIWREYTEYLQEKFSAQIFTLNRYGRLTDITSDAITQLSNLQSTDELQQSVSPINPKGRGQAIYSIIYNGFDDPVIIRNPIPFADTSNIDMIAHAKDVIDFDIGGQQRLLLIKPTVCSKIITDNSMYLEAIPKYFEIFVQFPNNPDQFQISSCERHQKIAWKQNSDAFASIRIEDHQSVLALHTLHQAFDEDGVAVYSKTSETVLRVDPEQQITSLDWHPTENKLLLSIKTNNHSWDLYAYLIDEKKLSRITNDADLQIQARFSSTGKNIVYSSNYGGVFNIRMLNIATGVEQTISNEISAAMFPIVFDETNTLVFQINTAQGYEIHKKTLQPMFRRQLVTQSTTTPALLQVAEQQQLKLESYFDRVKSSPYSPWSTLTPQYFVPSIAVNNGAYNIYSINLSGFDALRRHKYTGKISAYLANQAYQATAQHALGVNLTYSYARLLQVHAASAPKIVSYTNNQNIVTHGFSRSEYLDTLYTPPLTPAYNWQVIFGYGAERLHNLSEDGFAPGMVDNRAIGIGLKYADLNQQLFLPYMSDGAAFEFFVESANAVKKTKMDGSGAYMQYKYIFSFGRLGSIAMQGEANWRNSDETPITLRQSKFDPQQFFRSNALLRGYVDGVASGRVLLQGKSQLSIFVYDIANGFFMPPIGFHELSANFYIESARFYDEQATDNLVRTAVGGELELQLDLGYILPLPLRLGYIRGADAIGGDTQYYLTLGM